MQQTCGESLLEVAVPTSAALWIQPAFRMRDVECRDRPLQPFYFTLPHLCDCLRTSEITSENASFSFDCLNSLIPAYPLLGLLIVNLVLTHSYLQVSVPSAHLPWHLTGSVVQRKCSEGIQDITISQFPSKLNSYSFLLFSNLIQNRWPKRSKVKQTTGPQNPTAEMNFPPFHNKAFISMVARYSYY